MKNENYMMVIKTLTMVLIAVVTIVSVIHICIAVE